LNIVIQDCQNDIDCTNPVAIFNSAHGDDVAAQSAEVQMMVYSTAEIRNLLASVSNGDVVDYKREGSSDFKWEAFVNIPLRNAFYSGSKVRLTKIFPHFTLVLSSCTLSLPYRLPSPLLTCILAHFHSHVLNQRWCSAQDSWWMML
jgi:hypothetical protein